MAALLDAVFRLRAQDLFAAIRTNRCDAFSHRLYADWLEQQGDPRGELIALHMMLDQYADDDDLRRFIAAYLWRHRSLVPAIDPWRVRYEWKWGFIERTWIERPTIAEVDVLLRHPSCAVLRQVITSGAKPEVHWRIEELGPTIEIVA